MCELSGKDDLTIPGEKVADNETSRDYDILKHE